MAAVKRDSPEAIAVPQEWVDMADRLVAKHGNAYSNILQACATLALSMEGIALHLPCEYVESTAVDVRDSVSLLMDEILVMKPEWKEDLRNDLRDLIEVGLDLAMERAGENAAEERQSNLH